MSTNITFVDLFSSIAVLVCVGGSYPGTQ